MMSQGHLRDDREPAGAVVSAGSAGVGARSSMADLLRLMGGETDDLPVATLMPVTLRRLLGGDTLFHQTSCATAP